MSNFKAMSHTGKDVELVYIFVPVSTPAIHYLDVTVTYFENSESGIISKGKIHLN